MTRVHPLYSLLKSVDQPALVRRIERSAPALLASAGALLVGIDTLKAPQEHRRERFIRSSLTAGMTIAAALAFRRLGPRLFKGLGHDSIDHFNIREATQKILQALPKVSQRLSELLNKAEDHILTPRQVHQVRQELMQADPKNGLRLFKLLIPDPEPASFKDLMSELGSLSMMGLFPVVGGIVGGVLGNKFTGVDVKQKLRAQTSEAIYQFAANIALCNVGAAASLGLLEMLNIRSRTARLGAMTTGIALVGVLGGSAIANFFSKHFVNGILDKGFSRTFKDLRHQVKQDGVASLCRDLNNERRPELLDMGLHVDDFAGVGVLAGMAWLKPLLMALYSISGYRAGVGHRSSGHHKGKAQQAEHKKQDNPFIQPPPQRHAERARLQAAAFSAGHSNTPTSPGIPSNAVIVALPDRKTPVGSGAVYHPGLTATSTVA